MIIITLTTIPPRIENLHFTINSLFFQTVLADLIIINIPLEYNNYPNDFIIPQEYLNNKKIFINRCKDYGPATKLLGISETEVYKNMKDDDIIIVVDDDRMYNNNMVKQFLTYRELYPDKVLTVAGWDINLLTKNILNYSGKKLPRGIEYNEFGYIDILGGCCGFSITKKICPFNNDDIFNLLPTDDKYYVDDIWFSGFFTINNIDICLMPNYIKYDETRSINTIISSLYNSTRNNKNVLCIQYFMEKYNIWK